MDASPPLAIPRLRLPRYSPQSQALSPIAGPSHNSDYLHPDEDDEDAESTPRMSTSAMPDKSSPRSPAISGLPSEPTARLRALLARVPNSPNGATPHARPPLTLPSSSEPESDFEPPHVAATASSFARESLKELFSHALREPGNTPRKMGRPRRNSIDASEVEASPRVEEERAKYKGKRRTLSDEEADKSRYSDSSARSHRSSAASTFAALKQRLDQSTSAQMVMDVSMSPLNSSTDTAMPPIMKVDPSSDTPPRATSTPMRTFQMSAHLGMHSNLLEQDSEMQDVLQGMDSYESAPVPRQRHNSTPGPKHNTAPSPTPRPQPHGHSPARPFSWSSHSKSHSVNKLPPPPPARRGSEDLDISSSRASSSLSGADYHERQDETKREQMHGRERGWNSPVPRLPPKSPALSGKHDLSHRHSWGSPSNGRGSPAHRLNRKDSAASLSSIASTDDGRPSSRASSTASRSEYKERVEESEKERYKEREREWNKPHPKLSRSSSNLSLNTSERVRTISTPARPESSTSYLSPISTKLQRHGSASSLSSSRPSSPTGSVSGQSVEMEVEHEIDHLRERNWNSPHPDWHLHHRRPLSPLPRSRPGSPTGTPPRSRTNSITHGNSLSVPSSAPRSRSPIGDRVPRSKSPMLHTSVSSKASPHGRPHSPVTSTPPPEKAEFPKSGFGSRFGWSFPQHKHEPLPPLELDEDSPRRPLSRPSSRTSLAASTSTPSHIPIRSPRKKGHGSTSSVSMPSAPAPIAGTSSEKKNRHRRSVTEFSEAVGSLPPKIEVSSSDDLPPVPIVDDDFSSSASEDDARIVSNTPTAKPVPLPLPEPSTTPVSEPPARRANGYSDVSQPSPGSPLASPPLTPPGADSQPTFNLQTPPRRPQFLTPRQDFETPPPPRGMPDLPGPPSSDDEGEDVEDHTPLIDSREAQGDLTSLKTPRPPGAWMATPAPSRQLPKEPVERAGSAPPPDFNSSASSDSGLATPPATLSRATSLPPQTPAPPGGWVATPAAGNTVRRGSILKVRFDLKAETASEAITEGDDSLESRFEGEANKASSSVQGASPNGDASASSVLPEESSAEPPPSPPSIRDRTRKKSPGIRILDAFGREKIESEPQPAAQEPPARSDRKLASPTTPRKSHRSGSSATPRNRSGVRVVDAMGREIEEEPAAEDSILSQTPLTHNEALSRIKDTLSCMKHELSDADRSSDDAIFDARMYAALQEQCMAAEGARSKISQSLQMAQSAESELKGKYSPFRSKIAQSAIMPSGGADIRLSWNLLSWRFVVGFILVQLLLLVLMYRYSFVQARKVFLTTYHDSFYPELYIYLLKPDTIQHTIPSCTSWSFFTIFSSWQRAGFLGAVSDAWQGASCAVTSYFQSTWVGWHYAQDTVAHSWPPT